MSSPDTRAPAIELVGLHKSFGTAVAVRDVNLTVQPGEFFSLLGPSGCGKTTTLRMLAGFESPTAGSILMHGKDVTAMAANTRPTNLVFQKYELFPHMSVFDNVAFGLRVKKVPKNEIADRVRSMLDVTGVAELAERRAEQLSGGQQQRVALARALVNRPEVLLLDEPLSALDAKLRKRMQVELKEIQARLGTTFLYVTHDQEESLMMSDRIGVMNAGRLEQVGTPHEIYEEPATAFVADFIGAINTLDLVADAGDDGQAICKRDNDAVLLPPGTPLGSRVTGLLRPERVAVATGAAAPGLSSLTGTISRVTYAGANTIVVIDTAAGTLNASVVSNEVRDELATGARVVASWEPDALRVLPTTRGAADA